MKVLKYPSLCQTYDWDCGPSILQSVLLYYGIYVKEGELIKSSGADQSGTYLKGMYKVLNQYGLDYTSDTMDIVVLKNYIYQKIPVILMVQAWSDDSRVDWQSDWQNGHFVTLIGYDKNKLIFADPYSPYLVYLNEDELSDRWHDIDTIDKQYYHYGIAVKGKLPAFRPSKLVHMD